MLYITYIMQELYTSLQLTYVYIGSRNLGSEAQLQHMSHTPAVCPGLGLSGTLWYGCGRQTPTSTVQHSQYLYIAIHTCSPMFFSIITDFYVHHMAYHITVQSTCLLYKLMEIWSSIANNQHLSKGPWQKYPERHQALLLEVKCTSKSEN